MIYTITFNPAIDYVVQVNDMQLGQLNRMTGEDYVIGGKGINVSVMLKNLGQKSVASGFLAGFTGRHIEDKLGEAGIDNHFIQVDGQSRINVKLKSNEQNSTSETEINGQGPQISREDFQQLYDYFDQNLIKGDVVFLAGNTAQGMDDQDYQTIAKLCLEKEVAFVLDSNTKLLTSSLVHKPFIIKPNQDELGAIFDKTIETQDEVIRYAKELQTQGARNVLVSLGGDGSLLVTENQKIYSANAPKGQVTNSVGAGDSMLAGFMAEFVESQSYEEALRQGAAAGSATAFSVGIGEANQIEELKKKVVIEEIDQ